MTLFFFQFTCCMGGWKSMRGVTLCPARCCAGYEERTLEMPLLKSPVVCHKLSDEEMLQREEQMKDLEKERATKKQKEKEEQMRKMELQKQHQQQRISHNSLKKLVNSGYMEDEPRRDTRGSGEYEEFLLRNLQFFRDLFFQGYTSKDLISGLEKFLNAHLSPSSYELQPHFRLRH
ncbi:unnamed protein product [Meganyctiphanes norvegica]|uniref:Uncharacterized protein n=1 Tax=Meganyctiphanes norvegica TaxID=48144 RepID=A0AAV2PHH1_MEGNR